MKLFGSGVVTLTFGVTWRHC